MQSRRLVIQRLIIRDETSLQAVLLILLRHSSIVFFGKAKTIHAESKWRRSRKRFLPILRTAFANASNFVQTFSVLVRASNSSRIRRWLFINIYAFLSTERIVLKENDEGNEFYFQENSESDIIKKKGMLYSVNTNRFSHYRDAFKLVGT